MKLHLSSLNTYGLIQNLRVGPKYEDLEKVIPQGILVMCSWLRNCAIRSPSLLCFDLIFTRHFSANDLACLGVSYDTMHRPIGLNRWVSFENKFMFWLNLLIWLVWLVCLELKHIQFLNMKNCGLDPGSVCSPLITSPRCWHFSRLNLKQPATVSFPLYIPVILIS